MSRKYKTSRKKRTDYIFYSVDGTRITITPGEDEVTEAYIELLHSMDDEEVDKKRREDYQIKAHLEDYKDKDDKEAKDRDKHLADYSTNPEHILSQKEKEAEHEDLLDRLRGAMESLTDRQKEIYKLSYVDGLSNVAIAKELGISEAMVRKHLKKMHTKLFNILS
jgi:RNA polymerase sigma factor (sigma-70 family)